MPVKNDQNGAAPAKPEFNFQRARQAYRSFIDACRAGPAAYRLTPRAEPTAYALCFALFGLHLLQDDETLAADRDALVAALLDNIRSARAGRSTVPTDKGYRQLLAFTLSALAVLDALGADPLRDLVEEQLPPDMTAALHHVGAMKGVAQSGNQAMFLAIFTLHARDHLGRDTGDALDQWVDAHLAAMNRHGFWGADTGPTHLHFQNGYHQYEILEYLGVAAAPYETAAQTVATLADAQGHFAPYPGGGGCYDYDAVFMLTPDGACPSSDTASLLRRTAATLLAEQRPDGGFCESLLVRPRSVRTLAAAARHIAAAGGNAALLKERLRYNLALQRPLHDRVNTHWSKYQRAWYESDLWDSWFRMLTLARIETAFRPSAAERWGFIDYPGIGWHPALRRAPEDSQGETVVAEDAAP